jgi:chemotaxis protein CheX
MKAEFINPFISALRNVLSTMAQTELTPGKPTKKKDSVARGDVSGLIGMVGPNMKGSMSITFDESLALEIMQRMLGEKPESLNEEVTDMVGEITNMVAGGAKNTLGDMGYDFGMATPIVVAGKDHTINHQVDGPRLIMPFKSDAGQASLEICFDKAP